jgi:predicted N-acetyltransferase YhbS
MAQILIRGATADDAARLTEIAKAAKAGWGYPPEWMARWAVDLTITPAYLSAHRVFVAATGSAVVGVCALEDHVSHWLLEHVWVDPAAQRAGIGRLLVGHALSVARAERPDPVRVVADPFATGFYVRLGARPSGALAAPMPGAPERVTPVLEFGVRDAGVTFDRACALVEPALRGSFRQDIVAELSEAQTLGHALKRLRGSMRDHVWKSGTRRINLAGLVADYDRRTRDEGFHALNDWDGIADRVNDEIIPVDVLDYVAAARGADPVDAGVVAVLIDYYFFHVLSLLSLRVWDDGDADANLDRVTDLLLELQGPNGGGQPFARDAETLLLIATSHYERDERGYEALLARVRTLSPSHQTVVAMGHAGSMGCHLRFGFEATYGRDMGSMRSDNLADYPWLCFALATLMREYARLSEARTRGPERDVIVEALVSGLMPDAGAFIGSSTSCLSACEAERAVFRDLFVTHQAAFVEDSAPFRPADATYSPASFFFNFSHNVLKGIVIDALLVGESWPVTFNDLLTALPFGGPDDTPKIALATTLMGYARANPHTIRGRLMPVIVYDPSAGRLAFAAMMRALKAGAD